MSQAEIRDNLLRTIIDEKMPNATCHMLCPNPACRVPIVALDVTIGVWRCGGDLWLDMSSFAPYNIDGVSERHVTSRRRP